ncbi:hypothetical protein DICPUDRAFT_153570 [Dictyostelium purpureum]|uniref:FNIP repeat-containing protein n=1 Tax=Dictyostelium purpureum TaxID=5786 RepID=F0ZP79_DICPU|nr:uncharacterized protein DICPUDRAFT_153570 [Dictyostelium purpureum]EGC34257.1 hypothetical protein DICPUDRAFT_153570 [Dictyostelium purpureum]|eukprot:XP_003289226.1 hypothetical protein DICPUDRAFT_153570 [Dictyostelium purpureum]
MDSNNKSYSNTIDSVNNKNDILFKKIWNNIVIRKKIKFYLNFFNLYYHTRIFTIKEYESFKFKSFLRSIILEFDNTDKHKLFEWMSELPPNIEQIRFKNMVYFRNPTFHSFKDEDFDPFGRPLTTIDIPPQISHISFDPLFNQPFLEPLPNTLKSVELCKFFRQPLHCANDTSKSFLPEDLQELRFYFKGLFNTPIEKHHLPKKLRKMVMGLSFNQPIGHGVLPDTLESLEFSYHFNQPLSPGVLPEGLTFLRFGNSYNQPLIGIPSTVRTLVLGTDFNQPIAPGQLPYGLRELIFSNTSQFNQHIDTSILPNTITKLNFGCGFYQPLTPNSIPPSVTELSLGGSPNTIFGDYWSINANLPTLLGTNMISKYIVTPNCLPKSINALQLNPSFFIKKGSIPNSVYELQGCNFKFVQFIPQSVHKLKLNNDFNRPFKMGELPSHLLTLDLGGDYDQPITTKTFLNNPSLTKLKLSTHFKSTIQPFSLPPLKKLYLGFSYNNPQPFNIPQTLTYLDLGNEMNQPLHNFHMDTAASLKYLKLGSKFNQTIIPCSLPLQLILLELGTDFSQPIDTNWLPPNLKALIIQGSNTTIDEFPLSPLLEYIIIPNNNNKFINSLYDLNNILKQKRKIKKYQLLEKDNDHNNSDIIVNDSNEEDIYEYDLFNVIKVSNYNNTKLFSKYYKIFKENKPTF